MTLTLADGPLASHGPDAVNYAVDGPRHRMLFGTFSRRVRATFNGQVVFDTAAGRLLHESNLLPVLYVPDTDVRQDLLVATDHTTHCPFKGDAAYWSIEVGDRTAAHAVWAYPSPNDDAAWLKGHMAFYWDRLDAWFDEDEQVHGHLRDPYHRVDARRSSRKVVVRRGDAVLAASTHPVVVSETGLPNRFYLPRGDVVAELESSTTRTHCAYKGWATSWSLRDAAAADAAWSYEEPFSDIAVAAGHVCFAGDDITTEVDGVVVPG